MSWIKNPFKKKALTDDQLLEMLGGGVPTATGLAVSVPTALQVPAVAAAVRTIAEAAASLKVKVVEIAADRTETEVPGHPVLSLLRDDANDWTSGFDFIRSITIDALCRDQGGLAWVNRVGGEVREMIRYRPGYINVDYPDDSLAPRYRINGVIQTTADIIHVRGPFEKAPLTLCREAIGVAMVMEKHAARLFGRGARPGGVVQGGEKVGEEAIKKMIAGWKAAMDGSENAGKTAFLWGGAEWKQMTLSSVDAQFQQLRQFQIIEIVARGFGVPPSMVGDLTRATWSNSAEMQRQFLQLCLEPWLKALEGALRRALFSKDDRKKYAIRFDRDDFSNVDLVARATAINSLVSSRVINPNEGRDWLDLPPYEGGNEYANPNTGSSQPGVGHNGGPKLDDEKTPDEEKNDDDA